MSYLKLGENCYYLIDYFEVALIRNGTELRTQYCGGTLVQSGPPRCRGSSRGIATPALLCHKEPTQGMQNTPISLWHKGAYNRSFMCASCHITTYLYLLTSSPVRSITSP